MLLSLCILLEGAFLCLMLFFLNLNSEWLTGRNIFILITIYLLLFLIVVGGLYTYPEGFFIGDFLDLSVFATCAFSPR